MHQAFDTLLDLHERTVGHQVDDLAAQAAADRVTRPDILPRIRLRLFETQRDALAVAVDIEDHHLDLVAHSHHLRRVTDPAPAHIRDMQQAVHAIEVYEDPEICNILGLTKNTLADLKRFHQLLALRAQALLNQLTTRQDDVATLFADLEDLEFVPVVEQGVGVVYRNHINLRSGQEGLDAVHIHNQATAYTCFDHAFDHTTLAKRGQHTLPLELLIGLLLAEDNHAVVIFNLGQKYIQLIADCNLFHISEFVRRNDAFRLVADVDQDFVVPNLQHFAGYDRSLFEVFEGLLIERGHTLAVAHGEVYGIEVH